MIPVSSLWSWGELFTLSVPDNIIISDREHAIELVPARYTTTAEPVADQRQSARAWLTVFDHPHEPSRTACISAITRFAASLGVTVPGEAVYTVADRGAVWGRLDFFAGDDDWHLVAVGWNDHILLVFAVATDLDPTFADGVDRVVASWRPVEPIVAGGDELPPDTDF